MVIVVVTWSRLAAVKVSCISTEKPTSPLQLVWPTIVKLPSLMILPRWIALPVPAVVAVLWLVNVIVPSSPTRKGRFSARTAGESLKQTSASGMRRKASRKGDRPIDFLKCRVVIFFVEVELLNCI
jgi:hypothetical protein